MRRALDTKTFVVVGEGLAAGAGHFSLSSETQATSFPALVARQLGSDFAQPLIQAPGVGNIGFQHLPAVVPDLLQTSVLEGFPEVPPLNNFAVPGASLVDALEHRPRAPMVWPDDAQQTLTNLILGVPGLTRARGTTPTQVEAAKARKPTLTLVALGYQEVLEPLVEGHVHGDRRADLKRFAKHYAELLAELGGRQSTVVATTVPNPLHTAYFSSLETAAKILRTEPDFLASQFGLSAGDHLRLEGLVEIGYQFMARQVTGKLPAGAVLTAGEAAIATRGVDKLNLAITQLAEEHDALIFDLHEFLQGVARNGVAVADRQLSAGYLGGFYLLNGVFPGPTGHALIANQLLALLSQHADRVFEPVDVAAILEDDSNAQAELAPGSTATDEFLQERTAADMPPLPPADPAVLNFFPPFDPAKFNIFPIQTAYPDSPFDFGGVKAANKCVPKQGIPAGGFSDPRLKRALELPEGLEQTLELDKDGSFFGDALRAVDAPDERPFIAGLPTFGASGNVLFGGLAMLDCHLEGKIHIRFSEPEDGRTRFVITHPGGLTGDDGVLAAPKLFRMPAQHNRVQDVPGLVSSGELDLATGQVTNFRYNVLFVNTPIHTLFNANPGLPPGPLPQIFPGPPNGGSTWARFDQRPDGKLDITLAANLWLPLGKETADGAPIRFPLPFANPDLECATILARGTSLHPHIHLTTRCTEEADLGERVPEIPVNTVRELTPFVHNNNFGDVFGLHIDELGGDGTGRAHLMGRLKVQFGPRFGDSVPFQLSFLPPGGLMSKDPKPLPYLPPGTSRGMIGFDEQLQFPSGVTYHQSLLSSSMDPNNLPIGVVDLKTGRVRGEFLNRAFVVQQLFVNLLSVEPCTPGDSFNYQGPARFENQRDGELMFSFDGGVYLPYPKGFRFPQPNEDGKPGFLVVAESRLDPFLRLQGMAGHIPQRGVLKSGPKRKILSATSSIGEPFTYAFSIPCNPKAADDAYFEYTHQAEGGTFRLTRLSWVRASNSRGSKARAGYADTITFGGFGTWSLDDELHQVSVHISTAADAPYVGIQIDGGTTSNVNTKPVDITKTYPLNREP